MIMAQYSNTILIFIMSSSVVQFFLLAFISIVTVNGLSRVRSGTLADPGEFPFMASVRINGVHICGGSIINNKFILTAGHCVRKAKTVDIKHVTVVTGSVQLSKDGFTSNVAAMDPGPGNGKDPATDVGLIKLAAKLEYNNYTTSIKYNENDLPDNDYATVIGWGSTMSNDTAAIDTLQYMYAFINNVTCGIYSFRNVICTSNGPTIGVCYGDSGSPLIYTGKVIGVVSRAVTCAKGLPDVYASVAHNKDYILLTLNTLQ